MAFGWLTVGGPAFAQGVELRGGIGSNDTASIASEPRVETFDGLNEPQPTPPPIRTEDLDDGSNSRATSVGAIGLINPDGSATRFSNNRINPEQSGIPRSDDDPYAALGLRLGSFLLFPVLDQTLGYTNNADLVAGGAASAFSQTQLGIAFQSDWTRHSLTGEINGSRRYFFNDSSETEDVADGSATARFDLSSSTQLEFGGSYQRTEESFTSNDLDFEAGTTPVNRPGIHTATGSVELRRSGGMIAASLRGSIERNQFDAIQLQNGSSTSQDDRNNNELRLQAQVGLDGGRAIQPFIRGTIGKRVYDENLDGEGFERDADIFALSVGTVVDLQDRLTGEVSVGYTREMFTDNRLDDLSGIVADAELTLTPDSLTSFTGRFSSELTPSTQPGDSGSLTYAGSLSASRRVRDNLTLSAEVSSTWEDFDSGRLDQTLQASASAEWSLNRFASVIARVGMERFESNEPGASYEAATGQIGLRLKR